MLSWASWQKSTTSPPELLFYVMGVWSCVTGKAHVFMYLYVCSARGWMGMGTSQRSKTCHPLEKNCELPCNLIVDWICQRNLMIFDFIWFPQWRQSNYLNVKAEIYSPKDFNGSNTQYFKIGSWSIMLDSDCLSNFIDWVSAWALIGC